VENAQTGFRLWVCSSGVYGLLIGSVAFLGFGQSPAASVLLGAGLALSSTAFGLQSLAESRELHAAHGKLAFAILLFQDMAAIPLIAIVPLIAPKASPVTKAPLPYKS
jgi:glutathione-regulated potassium-efflux system protein KefB